jgi:hypothetical protein
MLIRNENGYKLAAILFAFAALAFLIAGVLGGFQTVNIFLAFLFVLNSVLYFTLSKRRTTNEHK